MLDPDDKRDSDRSDKDLWVRPYTATQGRTHPSTVLDLMSLVKATGSGTITHDRLGYEHAQALRLCHAPIAVAEVAALLHQPTNVTKVLLSDLIDVQAVIVRPPAADSYTNNVEVMEALLDGLRKL